MVTLYNRDAKNSDTKKIADYAFQKLNNKSKKVN